MSDTTPQSVSNGCRKYVKSRIKFNTLNTFNNVEFIIYDTIGEMQQAILQRQQKQQLNLFADTKGFNPGEKEWKQLVSMFCGELGDELRKVEFVSYDGKTVLLKASREQCKKVESCLSDDVIAHVKKCSKQVFGKVIAWNYSLSDN